MVNLLTLLIGDYIMKNSLQEPYIVRRLQEVSYLLFIPIKAGWFLTMVKLYTGNKPADRNVKTKYTTAYLN